MKWRVYEIKRRKKWDVNLLSKYEVKWEIEFLWHRHDHKNVTSNFGRKSSGWLLMCF